MAGWKREEELLTTTLGSQDEIEQSDKRAAAYHHAGYAVLASYLGSRCWVWLRRNESSDVENERTWVGSVRVVGGITPLMLVAGEIARDMRDGEDANPSDLLDCWEAGDVDTLLLEFDGSPTDPDERYQLLCQATEILGANRTFLDIVAAALVSEESITDGMVHEWARAYLNDK